MSTDAGTSPVPNWKRLWWVGRQLLLQRAMNLQGFVSPVKKNFYINMIGRSCLVSLVGRVFFLGNNEQKLVVPRCTLCVYFMCIFYVYDGVTYPLFSAFATMLSCFFEVIKQKMNCCLLLTE